MEPRPRQRVPQRRARVDEFTEGLSERAVEDFSFEAWVADLEAVVGAFARNVVPGAHAADRSRSRRVPRGARRLSGVRTPRSAKSVRWGLGAAHPSGQAPGSGRESRNTLVVRAAARVGEWWRGWGCRERRFRQQRLYTAWAGGVADVVTL